jgi:hypothetical protein
MGDGPANQGPVSVPSSSSSTHTNPPPTSGSTTTPATAPVTGSDRGGVTSTTPTASTGFRHQAIRIQEPSERRPLLPQRAAFSHNLDGDVFSCQSYGTTPNDANNNNNNNATANDGGTTPGGNSPLVRSLPVYTTIHRIRRDIISVVEDYLSLDQLRDVRLNVSVIRPLVDKLYEQDDISIVYALLVNRAQFLSEQAHLSNRQNVNFTRAMLCELIATRILRRFNEDNEGPRNLLVLAHILIAGFEPFQNAPESVRAEAGASSARHRTLPALEVAILSESRVFLASTSCQKM